MNTARPVEGYTRREADYPSKQMPPQLVQMDGESYMVVHAEGLTTGWIGMPDGTLTPVITIWSTPAPGACTGMALSFTPDDDMFDMVINSLTAMRDKARSEAKSQAEAVLRKAAGR